MTFGLAMLVSGMMSNGETTGTTTVSKQEISKSQTVEIATSSKAVASSTIPTNAGIEAKVRAYFADIPVMVEVGRCESRFRQFDKSGEPFRGIVNNMDVGVMQVNEYYHLKRAQKLGYNIYTVEGNLAYARLLYKESGTQPWNSSSPCWGKTAAAQADGLVVAQLK